jgi:ribonuclease HIII
MSDTITINLQKLEHFLNEKGWKVFDQKKIEYGLQVIVTDGCTCVPVNLYHTGRIVVQGRPGELKTALTEWANLVQAGLVPGVSGQPTPQNRIGKYLVIPGNIEKIRQVVLTLPGDVIARETGGPAELYRVEVIREPHRVTVTQYKSGTLLVQGLSSPLFDTVCEILDQHLTQSFSERAIRFVVGESGRAAAVSYLERPEAENEAVQWLFNQGIGQEMLRFLYENDQLTLLAAAGVRNAFQKTNPPLPDYSVVVMPFAKVLEGFLIRLAVHLGLTTEEALKQKASEIQIGLWLENIRLRLPDDRRYGGIYSALDAAWQCRNKAMHSDFAYPRSILSTFHEAEQEISTILRAMTSAHHIFVKEGLRLRPAETPPEPPVVHEPEHKYANVDRDRLRMQLEVDGYPVSVQPEGKRNVWEINQRPDLMVFAPRHHEGLIIVKGERGSAFCEKYATLLAGGPAQPRAPAPMAWIGVDESGKGDVFGPLVVAGVVVTSDTEVILGRSGVRDSKTLSNAHVLALAQTVQAHCPVEILMLSPRDYNLLYEQHGGNVNYLLAWAYAQVITQLSRRTSAHRAIADQFGDESLLIAALAAEGCPIALEQHPQAESDLAVAAASVVARAAFVTAMQGYSQEIGLDLPLGASASSIKEIIQQVYRQRGEPALMHIAKMHFKTVQEAIAEVHL